MEIGGYFEIEENRGKEYYNYLAFNSSRNALQFIVRKRNIRKVYLPYYLCLVVKEVLEKENVEIIYYHIDKNFEPLIENYDENIFVYVVNYFGLFNKKIIQNLKQKYKKMILDNTHNFFMKGFENIDIIYNCRKYFGVADGAYLYTDLKEDNTFKQAFSINRIKHLYGRYEFSANEYYNDFNNCEELFKNQDIQLMSKITHNMLRGIDYNFVLKRRKENFDYLNNTLKSINQLKNIETNFMYPLLIDNGVDLRKKLILKNIYIPKLWPELEQFSLNDFEKNILDNLVLIPIDQRYDINNMKQILSFIEKCEDVKSEK